MSSLESKVKTDYNSAAKRPAKSGKWVSPQKEGEVLQFSIEEKKKAELKEKDIFESSNHDPDNMRAKQTQARNKMIKKMNKEH